jgi:AcrR family transcriptional regulator
LADPVAFKIVDLSGYSLTGPWNNVSICAMTSTRPSRLPSGRRPGTVHKTRERILEAIGKGLGRGGLDSLSFADVARLAGVSDRTVHRCFPTRGKLLEAFQEWLLRRPLALKRFPATEKELVKTVPKVFAEFERHEQLFRSYLTIELAHGENQPGHLLWRQVVQQCLKDATRGLPQDEARRAVAVVQALFGSPAWRALRDRAGLSTRQAAAAVAWAIEVLVRELRLRREVSPRDEDDLP